jgi:sugar lactone lactonase YvrE
MLDPILETRRGGSMQRIRFVMAAAGLAIATGLMAAPLQLKVLVKGSPIHGANGIRFDSQDRLYIASGWGNEIVVMDPRTGKILDRVGADKGVFGPDDVAVGPDGSVYWTSVFEASVGRLAPDGSTKVQAVAPGMNPIAFTRDGRLFAGQCFLGDGLWELDPKLESPPRAINKQQGMLNGFDFGPDGRLYAPAYFEGRIVSLDVKADPATYKEVAKGFEVPSAVKFDSRGSLYGLTQMTGEVWVMDPATGRKGTVVRLPHGLDNLAFDSSGRLFVSHANDGAIYEIIMGAYRIVSPGGLIMPGPVAVVPRAQGGESVFVGDQWTLREFDGTSGRQLSTEVNNFANPSGIIAPFSVSADGANLVLSSWATRAVQVWNPDERKAVESYPDVPVPINATRFLGDIVVSELSTHSVIRLTKSGRTTLTDALIVPAGLAASGGDLYVSDWATGMVWKIMSKGAPVAIPVAKGLAAPEGIAVDLDGSLLVVETRVGKLSRIDASGNVTTLAEGLELGAPGTPNLPPTWAFNGVAVAPSGAIYVTGDKANVLYRLR